MTEYIKGRVVAVRTISLGGVQGVELDIAEHEGILRPSGFVKVQMDSRAFDHLLREMGIKLHRKGPGGGYLAKQFEGKKIVITIR